MEAGQRKGSSSGSVCGNKPINLHIFTAEGLTHNHFYKIRKSDAIYVLNVGGYIGNSATLEIGYAVALNKKIFFMEEENGEYARKVLCDGVAKTPRELMKRLKDVRTPDVLD